MSTHNSQQNELNTLRGTKNRSDTMMDLFDHGPILAIVDGRWTELQNVSMSINRDVTTVSTIELETTPIVNAIDIKIDCVMDKDVAYKASDDTVMSSVYIFTHKHDIQLSEPFVFIQQKNDDTADVTIRCTDYSVKHDWKNSGVS